MVSQKEAGVIDLSLALSTVRYEGRDCIFEKKSSETDVETQFTLIVSWEIYDKLKLSYA